MKIAGAASIELSEDEKKISKNCNVNFTGDCDPPIVYRFDELLEFMKGIKERTESDNSGRGSIIGYVLVPIKSIINDVEIAYYKVGEEEINNITQIKQKYQMAEQQLN